MNPAVLDDIAAIAEAQRRGASFIQSGDEWRAVLRRRGRVLPLVTCADPVKGEAARLMLSYLGRGRVVS